MAKANILLTGFGPFPGAPENPSAWLVEQLAASEPAAVADGRLHARVLPTEWSAVSTLTPRLLDEFRPRLIVHFGLSRRSRSFCIERTAHNAIARRADENGAVPVTTTILDGGSDRLHSPAPASTLAAHLKANGLAAAPSRSAGSYICNLLYYLSLDWASRQTHSPLACFVHIPPAAAQGGPFGDDDLVRGAKLILHRLSALARNEKPVAAGTPVTLAEQIS
jgi:pyroglutamyl-peptidase